MSYKNIMMSLVAFGALSLTACGGGSARSPEGAGGSTGGSTPGPVTPFAVMANPDAGTATEGGAPFTLSVLSNDVDDDPSTLFIVPGSLTAPGAGSATIVGNQIQYTPPAAGSGTVSFQYTVQDADGNQSTAVVTINVQPSGGGGFPVLAVADASIGTAVANGSPININVLLNDLDDDTATLMVTSVTQPGGVGEGSVTNNGTDVTYTPGSVSGVVTFQYTVTDADGNSAIGTVTVVVLPIGVNIPVQAIPDVSIGSASSTGGIVMLDVLANDIDDATSSLMIVGVSAVTPAGPTAVINNNMIDFNPSGSSGIFTFMYTVQDADGNQSVGLVTVVVSPNLASGVPVTAIPDLQTTSANTAVNVDVLLNDIDDATGTLTIQSVTVPNAGTATIASGQVNYDPMGFVGIATFNYVVQDADGNQSSALVTVVVTPDPANGVPVVAVPDAGTVFSNQTITVNVLSNDIDDATGTLTVTAVDATGTPFGAATIVGGGTQVQFDPQGNNGISVINYTVTDADGNVSTSFITIVSVPVVLTGTDPVAVADVSAGVFTSTSPAATISVLANDIDDGALVLTSIDATTSPVGPIISVSGNDVLFDPNGNTGIYTFNYVTTDPDGNTATALVTVVIAPDITAGVPVVAVPDISVGAATAGAGSVNIQLTANDIDDAQATLMVTGFTGVPAGATATIDGAGTGVDFDPGTNNGILTFMYTVIDADGLSSSALVTVLVAPDPSAGVPVLAVVDVVPVGATAGGAAIPISVLGNDIDNDMATLEVIAVETTTTAGSGATVAITAPGDGNTITFTPGAAGIVTFDYTVEDADGNVSSAIVTVVVAPAAPAPVVQAVPDVAVGTVNVGGGAGGSISIAALANDLGAGISLDPSAIVIAPADGTATVNGANIDFVSNTSTGLVTFTYGITDGTSTSTASITVAVLPGAGAPPVVGVPDIAPGSVAPGGGASGSINIPVVANDVGVGLTIVPGSIVIAGVDGSATVNADMVSIDFVSNTSTGLVMLTYLVTDGTTSSLATTVTVAVIPASPVVPVVAVDAVAAASVLAGQISIPVLVFDDVPGTVTYVGTPTVTAVAPPGLGGGTVDAQNNAAGVFTIDFTPTAAGVVTFVYTVMDADGLTDTGTVTVTITP